MRGTPGEIWCALLCACQRVVIFLNWSIGGLTLCVPGESIPPLQGIITINGTPPPLQTKPKLIPPYAPTPLDISAKSRVG